MTYYKKLHAIRVSLAAITSLFLIGSPLYPMGKKLKDAEEMEEKTVWIHNGFEDFSKGQFDNAGGNLYVNAAGVIEMINNLDVNSDGYVDLVLANSHDRIERGPTWAYSTGPGPGENWKRHEMSADSGWMSRVIDVDGDGHNDLVTVNSQNGVSSELDSYIYWGGPEGPEADRTDLPTIGAFDVAPMDINGDGKLDIVVVNRDAPAYILHNISENENALELDLRNANSSPAIGTIVTFNLGDKRHRHRVRSSRSYFSSMSPVIHVGLGKHKNITDITINWATGKVTTIPSIEQGKTIIKEPIK